MAFTLKDRVKETTTTTGNGTVTLLGAVSGFEAFSVIGNTNTTYYAIVHQSEDEWEVGIGTYTASGTTLARTTVLSSTNSDAAVVFSAGTKDVFVTYPADKAVYVSASPAFVNVSIGGALTGVSAAFTNHVSVNSLAVVGATSIGGALSGVSATFSNHVSANTLGVVGITSIGGSLVGTSATFGDHVSVSSLGVTGNIGVGVAAPLARIHIAQNAIANIVSLTDEANVSISFQNGQNFSLTLEGNRALSNPTECVPGQVGSIFLVQDGTGGRTLSYGTSWEFPGASAPTISTSGGAVDRMDYIVRTSTGVQAILSKEYS